MSLVSMLVTLGPLSHALLMDFVTKRKTLCMKLGQPGMSSNGNLAAVLISKLVRDSGFTAKYRAAFFYT